MQQSGINSADELSHIEAPVSVNVATPPPEGMGMIWLLDEETTENALRMFSRIV